MINTKIKRPALRYHGGKFRIALWIISHFPKHTCYVEPFGGGGSVLLRKAPAKIEVYNDLNGQVVNFFKVLRERSQELLHKIEMTPYSREEFRLCQETTDDPVESARRFFVWSWQGRGRAGVKEAGGWRFMSRDTRGTTPVDDFAKLSHLHDVVERLRHVQIENDDALKVIKRFATPETLFYVDPPYVQSVCGKRWGGKAYTFSMVDDEHRNLSDALKSVQGMVLISGYPSSLYDELYSNWKVVRHEEQKDNGLSRKSVECLWLSPRLAERLSAQD